MIFQVIPITGLCFESLYDRHIIFEGDMWLKNVYLHREIAVIICTWINSIRLLVAPDTN